MKSKLSAAKSKPAKPGRQYRRLSTAVTEMQAIRRGEAAPSRAWEVVSDGKGGFVRRQIKHSGGLRKVRWSLPGRGKSGGVRVIYYWWVAEVKPESSSKIMGKSMRH